MFLSFKLMEFNFPSCAWLPSQKPLLRINLVQLQIQKQTFWAHMSPWKGGTRALSPLIHEAEKTLPVHVVHGVSTPTYPTPAAVQVVIERVPTGGAYDHNTKLDNVPLVLCFFYVGMKRIEG